MHYWQLRDALRIEKSSRYVDMSGRYARVGNYREDNSSKGVAFQPEECMHTNLFRHSLNSHEKRNMGPSTSRLEQFQTGQREDKTLNLTGCLLLASAVLNPNLSDL